MSYPDQYLLQLRDLQRSMDQLRPQLSVLESMPKGISEQIAQFASIQDQFALPSDYLNVATKLREIAIESFAGIRQQMELLASTRESFAMPADYLQEMAKLQTTINDSQISQLKALAGPMSGPSREILQFQHELDGWARRLAEPNQIYLANNYVLDSLITTEALLQTQRLREDLLISALQPQVAYQDFARQQLELVAASASDVVKRNRLTVVDSAAELLRNMNSGFELAMLMNPVPPVAYYAPFPPIKVYAELTVEIEEFDLEESDVDIESAVLESKPGRITQLGSRLVRQVYGLNLVAERKGEPHLFKPTNKLLYSCSVVPTQVATDEQSFAEIIDHLYFLLYEGSGAAKRLTEKCAADSLKALWKVKDLRTGSRHDVDHGEGKDIEKKNRQIGEAYRSLIGSVVPRTTSEWLQAQISLYEQLSDMLEAVEDVEDGS